MKSQASGTKIELFYNPMCGLCPQAKEIARAVAEERGVPLEEINVFTPDGRRRADGCGVKGVPTFVVNGAARFTGVPRREELLKMLET
ncbi:MAG: thioredoxin family protein [bacterium]